MYIQPSPLVIGSLPLINPHSSGSGFINGKPTLTLDLGHIRICLYIHLIAMVYILHIYVYQDHIRLNNTMYCLSDTYIVILNTVNIDIAIFTNNYRNRALHLRISKNQNDDNTCQ